MIFFYVRHGDPIYDPDMLTPLGQEQAKAIAKRFATFGLDRIYASSSTRAQETAVPTCQLLKKEMTVLDFATENLAWRDFTVTREDGRRTWCFQHEETVELFRSREIYNMGFEWYKHPALSENFAHGCERVDTAVDEYFLSLGYRHDREHARYEVVTPSRERVALFAHQGFGLAFLASVMDVPYPIFCTRFDMGHTGMTVINFTVKEEGFVYPRLLQVANDGHLYKEGILTGYHNIEHLRF